MNPVKVLAVTNNAYRLSVYKFTIMDDEKFHVGQEILDKKFSFWKEIKKKNRV